MAVKEPPPGTLAENSPPEYQSKPKVGPHDLVIDVLDTKFSITAGEPPEYLDEVLAQYRLAVANTRNIWGMKDPLKVAILTGFLLCDEINKLKTQFEEEQAHTEALWSDGERELNHITQSLITRLDRVFDA